MTIIKEIKKHTNTILTIVFGVLAIIFYFNSNKKGDLSFQITEPTSLIFDSNNPSSKIQLFESDSIPITENVYLLTGTIWNSGDLPINKEDVRKKLSFELRGANRILDYKIIKQKDSSVAGFRLSKVGNIFLDLDWKFFDPKYGFTFQIIYTGNVSPDFNITGVVLGVSEYNKVNTYKPIGYSFLFVYILFLFYFLREFFLLRKRNKMSFINNEKLVKELDKMVDKESPKYKDIQSYINEFGIKERVNSSNRLSWMLIMVSAAIIYLIWYLFIGKPFSI